MTLINDYLKELELNNMSKNTIKSYREDLKQFGEYISNLFGEYESSDEKIIYQSLRLKDMNEYKNHLISELGLKASSVNRKMTSVSTLYKYLIDMEVVENNPVSNVKRMKVKQDQFFFTKNESEILIKHCKTLIDRTDVVSMKFEAVRNKFIIELVLNLGLRNSELVNIKFENIKGNKIEILGKGDKKRSVFLNDYLMEQLCEYMKYREMYTSQLKDKSKLNNEYIFINCRGGSNIGTKATLRMLRKVVASNEELCKYTDKVEFHSLRHTMATDRIVNKHQPIALVSKLLGHSNVNTTLRVYTHILDEDVKKLCLEEEY